MKKKVRKIIGGLIVISLLSTGCSTREEFIEKKSSLIEADQASIVGTYVGNSPRQWLLHIYEDGILQLDGSRGTYDEVGDAYILTVDGYAYTLKAEITDNGDLYITSDNSNWDAEIYRKHTPADIENRTIELANSIGNNWENFCEKNNINEYEQFDVVEEFDDGTYESNGDLGTEIEVSGDGNLCYIGIGEFESAYTLCGAYIGQDYTEGEKNVVQYGMNCVQERVYNADENEEYDSYSMWRCEQFDLYIHERAGKIAVLAAFWNH